MSYTTLIDAPALRRLLASGAGTAGDSRLVLLDCRFELTAPAAGRQSYLSGHIPGAHHADLDQVLAAPVTAATGRHPLPDPRTLAARFAAFGIGRDTQVVAYDDAAGLFAARAWWLLRWLGHSAVAVLDGGLKAWVADGGALESGTPGIGSSVPADDPRTRAPSVDAAAVVSAAEVLQSLNDSTRLLLDARAPERYAGAVEPIDTVAGHVPGAVNHPIADNLAPDGRFLNAVELRRRWRERLADIAPENTTVMCGSGVSACHNLLAMEIAGLPGAKLYAGSWSEWIRDPRRPIARGPKP